VQLLQPKQSCVRLNGKSDDDVKDEVTLRETRRRLVKMRLIQEVDSEYMLMLVKMSD